MKINYKKWLGFAASSTLLLAALNSCVKNRNDLATDFSQIKPVVELLSEPQYAATPKKFQALAYSSNLPPQSIKLYVHYAAPDPAPNDIVVTLALDPTTIADYNTANGTNYQLMATTAWSIDNFKVTIKKGETYGIATITITPSLVNLAASNAIAFKIVDAQGITISANFANTMYGILVKNQYDADYLTTGWFFHPSVGRALNAIYHISTVSAIRSETPIGDLAGLGYYFQFDVSPTNTLVNWSSTGPGGGSGFMTADNPGGTDYSHPSNAGHLPGDALFNSTIYNNTYDPATKTFWMHHGYATSGAGGQSTYTRQIYEKMVRQ